MINFNIYINIIELLGKIKKIMHCSLCGSFKTNKSTCPLNPKAINKKYRKHDLNFQKGDNKSLFWEFVDSVNWLNSNESRASLINRINNLFSRSEIEQIINIEKKLRDQLREKISNDYDFGGGDDWVDMDLPDAVFVRGKKFYDKMLKGHPKDLAKFGRSVSNNHKEGFYALINDLEID